MENEHTKNKHLTLENRIEIQECLCKGMTFKAIAKRIGKDPTTISKEIKLHKNSYSTGHTRTETICPKLLKAPFVCNGCSLQHQRNCPYVRCKYTAKLAQQQYEETLRDSREGIPLNKESFYKTEQIISDGVRSGQHIYQIIHANKLSVHQSTVYRYIHKGYYSVALIDLPRAVKFKPRKTATVQKVPNAIRKNRVFQDFLDYMENHPNTAYVEMDTVIGRPGGKVIMTFQFVNVDFMFGILLDNKQAAEAAAKITDLKQRLAQHNFTFGDVFPVLLTDNGGEFSNVFAFENNLLNEQETHVFFCNPQSPYQKPHVENNHTLFRSIVPSGSSFDGFTQDTVNLIFSHVNGVLRKQFNGKSAYDMFIFTYSQALADVLGIRFVPPTEVIQSPKLLK